jgi:hypothetical protein
MKLTSAMLDGIVFPDPLFRILSDPLPYFLALDPDKLLSAFLMPNNEICFVQETLRRWRTAK